MSRRREGSYGFFFYRGRVPGASMCRMRLQGSRQIKVSLPAHYVVAGAACYQRHGVGPATLGLWHSDSARPLGFLQGTGTPMRIRQTIACECDRVKCATTHSRTDPRPER